MKYCGNVFSGMKWSRIGIGLTAVGVLTLREAWWPSAAGYFAVLSGSAVLLVVAWRWLERDRDRLLRWSDEHRLRAFSRAAPPEPPAPGPVLDGRRSLPAASDSESLTEPVEPVGVGPPAIQ